MSTHLYYIVLDLVVMICPFIGFMLVKKGDLRSALEKFAFSFPFAFIPLILWDGFATDAGHWSFNNKYIVGLKLAGLPIEEVLFFVAIPLSCILLFEFLKLLLKDFPVKNAERLFFGLGIIVVILAFFARNSHYTLIALAFTAVIFFISSYTKTILYSGRFWIFLCVSYILFFIVNTILTALPIVLYSPEVITGIRIGTIPIEDFIFSFIMLFLYTQVYELAPVLLLKRKKKEYSELQKE